MIAGDCEGDASCRTGSAGDPAQPYKKKTILKFHPAKTVFDHLPLLAGIHNAPDE